MKRDLGLLLALATTGGAALGFEVIWSRALIPWVGGTAMAQITTVAIYMLGLFAGAVLGVGVAARSERPRSRFLAVEALAAILSVLAIFALPLGQPVFALCSRGELLSGHLGSTLRGLAGGGLMLPATVMMGLSFPLAIAALQRAGVQREAAALAYGFNTVGAALGTCLAGFVLVPRLGVVFGSWTLLAVDLLVLGYVALRPAPRAASVAAKNQVARKERPPVAIAQATRMNTRSLHAAVLVGGVLSLALEVVLFRLLGMLLGPTARAFSVVLASYVVGLGLGSLLVHRWLARSAARARAVFVLSWWFVAGFGFLLCFGVAQHPQWLLLQRAAESVALSTQIAQRAWIAAMLLVPLTMAFGASYSAAVAAAGSADSSSAGRLYASLTLGNILGLVIGATWMLPKLGMEQSLHLLFVLALCVPLPVLWFLPRAKRFGARWWSLAPLAAGALAATSMPPWNWKILNSAPYLYEENQHVRDAHFFLMLEPGFETTVAVTKSGDELLFTLDGKTDGSNTAWDMSTQSTIGVLPTLLHPHPRRALVVGLGTGQTAADMLALDYQRLDCAELSDGVVRAQRFFTAINHGVLEEPRFRLLRTDARTVLRYSRDEYDVIVSEPSNVWVPGVAHLFTRQSFEEARARLRAPGGVFCQWLHAYSLDPDAFRTVARTFLEVFPHATLWTTGLQNEEALFIGTLEPLSIALGPMLERLTRSPVENHGAPGQELDVLSVLRNFVAGPERLREFAGSGPLTLDSRPSLEYVAETSMATQVPGSFHQIVLDLLESPAAWIQDPPAELQSALLQRAAATLAIRTLLLPDRPAFTDDDLVALAERFPGDLPLRFLLTYLLSERATSLLENGHFEEGRVLVDRALEWWPDHARSIRLAVLLDHYRGERTAALQRLDQWRANYQGLGAEPWAMTGELLLMQGNPTAAERFYRQTLERDPLSLQAWLGLANCAASQRKSADQRLALERALELDPWQPEVRERLRALIASRR